MYKTEKIPVRLPGAYKNRPKQFAHKEDVLLHMQQEILPICKKIFGFGEIESGTLFGDGVYCGDGLYLMYTDTKDTNPFPWIVFDSLDKSFGVDGYEMFQRSLYALDTIRQRKEGRKVAEVPEVEKAA